MLEYQATLWNTKKPFRNTKEPFLSNKKPFGVPSNLSEHQAALFGIPRSLCGVPRSLLEYEGALLEYREAFWITKQLRLEYLEDFVEYQVPFWNTKEPSRSAKVLLGTSFGHDLGMIWEGFEDDLGTSRS